MKIVTIGVKSRTGAKARLAEAMRGKAQKGPRIDFASPDLLWKVLAPNRQEILRAMC
ncbi:MAG: hypothetical protein JO133_07925, partial [Burkholderiaceae bacterium]|nr:hypothetical protein [Burkholderiaceae bacterium]